jgi:FKBP-type peptidyl-prolyl cis-trans isomerase (trigger factor)
MEKTLDLKKTTKKQLFELLRNLRGTNDHYVLKENGSFLGVVIAREEYEEYLLRRQAEAQVGLEKVLAKIHSQSDQNISDEDLQKELDEAIHEMRGVK